MSADDGKVVQDEQPRADAGAAAPPAPPAPPRSGPAKAYTCTPKQLEALARAREARRQRLAARLSPAAQAPAATAEEGGAAEIAPAMQLVERGAGSAPTPVVRNHDMLDEFTREMGIEARQSSLGRTPADAPVLPEEASESPASWELEFEMRCRIGVSSHWRRRWS